MDQSRPTYRRRSSILKFSMAVSREDQEAERPKRRVSFANHFQLRKFDKEETGLFGESFTVPFQQHISPQNHKSVNTEPNNDVPSWNLSFEGAVNATSITQFPMEAASMIDDVFLSDARNVLNKTVLDEVDMSMSCLEEAINNSDPPSFQMTDDEDSIDQKRDMHNQTTMYSDVEMSQEKAEQSENWTDGAAFFANLSKRPLEEAKTENEVRESAPTEMESFFEIVKMPSVKRNRSMAPIAVISQDSEAVDQQTEHDVDSRAEASPSPVDMELSANILDVKSPPDFQECNDASEDMRDVSVHPHSSHVEFTTESVKVNATLVVDIAVPDADFSQLSPFKIPAPVTSSRQPKLNVTLNSGEKFDSSSMELDSPSKPIIANPDSPGNLLSTSEMSISGTESILDSAKKNQTENRTYQPDDKTEDGTGQSDDMSIDSSLVSPSQPVLPCTPVAPPRDSKSSDMSMSSASQVSTQASVDVSQMQQSRASNSDMSIGISSPVTKKASFVSSQRNDDSQVANLSVSMNSGSQASILQSPNDPDLADHQPSASEGKNDETGMDISADTSQIAAVSMKESGNISPKKSENTTVVESPQAAEMSLSFSGEKVRDNPLQCNAEQVAPSDTPVKNSSREVDLSVNMDEALDTSSATVSDDTVSSGDKFGKSFLSCVSEMPISRASRFSRIPDSPTNSQNSTLRRSSVHVTEDAPLKQADSEQDIPNMSVDMSMISSSPGVQNRSGIVASGDQEMKSDPPGGDLGMHPVATEMDVSMSFLNVIQDDHKNEAVQPQKAVGAQQTAQDPSAEIGDITMSSAEKSIRAVNMDQMDENGDISTDTVTQSSPRTSAKRTVNDDVSKTSNSLPDVPSSAGRSSFQCAKRTRRSLNLSVFDKLFDETANEEANNSHQRTPTRDIEEVDMDVSEHIISTPQSNALKPESTPQSEHMPSVEPKENHDESCVGEPSFFSMMEKEPPISRGERKSVLPVSRPRDSMSFALTALSFPQRTFDTITEESSVRSSISSSSNSTSRHSEFLMMRTQRQSEMLPELPETNDVVMEEKEPETRTSVQTGGAPNGDLHPVESAPISSDDLNGVIIESEVAKPEESPENPSQENLNQSVDQLRFSMGVRSRAVSFAAGFADVSSFMEEQNGACGQFHEKGILDVTGNVSLCKTNFTLYATRIEDGHEENVADIQEHQDETSEPRSDLKRKSMEEEEEDLAKMMLKKKRISIMDLNLQPDDDRVNSLLGKLPEFIREEEEVMSAGNSSLDKTTVLEKTCFPEVPDDTDENDESALDESIHLDNGTASVLDKVMETKRLLEEKEHALALEKTVFVPASSDDEDESVQQADVSNRSGTPLNHTVLDHTVYSPSQADETMTEESVNLANEKNEFLSLIYDQLYRAFCKGDIDFELVEKSLGVIRWHVHVLGRRSVVLVCLEAPTNVTNIGDALKQVRYKVSASSGPLSQRKLDKHLERILPKLPLSTEFIPRLLSSVADSMRDERIEDRPNLPVCPLFV